MSYNKFHSMSIVITGNPGVGKHTIAKEIAKNLEYSIIDINQIAKDMDLFEENQDTNDVDTEKLKKNMNNKNLTGSIIVGHLAPYVLDKHQVKIMVILRRSPYDLITTYKERKYTDKKSKENTGSEILGIITHEALSKFQEKSIQVNTSGKNVEEVIKKVMSIISDNTEGDKVDWLDLVVKNNDLKKFFVD